MSDINPFAAPKAELSDPVVARKRPRWVWAILIFYVLAAVGTAFSYFFLYSGKFAIPEEQRHYLESLNAFDHLLTILMVSANLFAGIQLFRLKKISAYVFPSVFGVGLLLTAWHALSKGWYAAMASSGFSRLFIGWGITVAICIYAWRLAKAGVLK